MVFHGVSYDETPPIYEVDSAPVVNTPELSFTLHESLAEAEILWVWERGRKDRGSPHSVKLADEAVKRGRYEYVSLRDSVDLEDGTVYTLFFQGTDLAGNRGPAVSLSGIRFDTRRPEFTWVKPADGEYVNAPVVSFSVSEELAAGTLIWRRTGGREDPRSPHQVPLIGSELKPGEHRYILPRNAPELSDGAIYDVVVRGSDLAGNASDSLVISGVPTTVRHPPFPHICPWPDG